MAVISRQSGSPSEEDESMVMEHEGDQTGGERVFSGVSFLIISAAVSLIFALVLVSCFARSTHKSRDASSFDDGDHTPNGPRANVPPRGWNSYDSFSWTINEAQFLSNAEILSKEFLQFGYEYMVVDFLWYRRMQGNESTVWSSGFDTIDQWGRPIPDPNRWSSSSGGVGFRQVSSRVHELGLKFGIHVMRGISAQAVIDNAPIMGTEGHPYEAEGRVWRAQDIALPQEPCKWMPNCFLSINTSLGAGRAFLESLYKLYDDWGVDFVKHDCVYGDDLNLEEIEIVSEILKAKENPILYSISPGTHVTLEMAEKVKEAVNMYRVTGDDWDSWRDLALHFDIARDLALGGFIGDKGLLGRSWPDLDMLPFGWITDPNSNRGPHRNCSLTLDEQKTQMTLWAMAKSPLFIGGDMRNMDSSTISIITNPVLLDIHNRSINNKESNNVRIDSVRIWVANASTDEAYIAFFNLGYSARKISLKLDDITGDLITCSIDTRDAIDIAGEKFRAFDVWGDRLGEINPTFSTIIPVHGCVLLVLDCPPATKL
ncbi:unnamed protein product [Victoria cruziana]